MLLERLDNGYRLFPDCRRYIDKQPSEYARRLRYDTCAFGEAALMFAIGAAARIIERPCRMTSSR